MLRRSFLSSTAALAASGLAPLPALAQPRDPLEAARLDPNAFVEYVSPFKQAPCHRRWQAAWNDPRSVVIGPSGFGKTTQALHRVLWEMGNNPEIEIAWLSDRPHRRVEWLNHQILTNQAITKVFPGLSIDVKASSPYEMTITRMSDSPDPTVGGHYINGWSALGTRADIVVMDAPERSARHIVLERLDEHEARLCSGARLMVLGAPHYANDPLFYLAAKTGWTVVHEDAIVERADGAQESLDPNIMTMDEIRRKERDLGPRMAEALLRCRPLG